MATRIVINGDEFQVPAEEDWDLIELAELARLRDRYGDIGATIAFVWIVKHRQDPSFTVEKAEKVKAAALDVIEEDDVPLDGSGGSSETSSSLSGPSETQDGSGQPLLVASTV